MPFKYHALLSTFILLLLTQTTLAAKTSTEPELVEQTLATIRDCMANSPAPWPEEWKQELLETIRKAVETHQHSENYVERLEILQSGFGPCWDSFTENKDKSRGDQCDQWWINGQINGGRSMGSDLK